VVVIAIILISVLLMLIEFIRGRMRTSQEGVWAQSTTKALVWADEIRRAAGLESRLPSLQEWWW
jgi:hypothetical protein